MIPDIETFRKIVRKHRGNLSRVADDLGVTRATVENWKNHSPEYKQVVRDARMRLFDSCLVTSEIVAMGIPIKDEEGHIIGWQERPDGNMLRYLLGKLGTCEGFGDGPQDETADESAEPSGIEINVTYNEKSHLDLQGEVEPVAAEEE